MPRVKITYLTTLWSRVLFEKLTGSQLVKEFPTLPTSQVPATCPYPEPDQSSHCPPHPTFWRSIL